jgi:hypothetical protein
MALARCSGRISVISEMRPGITKHGSARATGALTLPDSDRQVSHSTYLVDIGRLVQTPYLAQRVADLAHGRPGGQRTAQRVEHVVLPGRSALDLG